MVAEFDRLTTYHVRESASRWARIRRALQGADRLSVDARHPYRGGSDGHAKPAARDQALHPQAATRSGDTSETERAAEPRWRVEADPGLRARRLRQDHPAGRVAGSHSGREADGVALARPKRQSGRILLALCDRCAADGGARGRRDCALAPAGRPSHRRSRRSSRRCSTSSALCRTTSCWCSTTTTSIDAHDIQDGMAFLLEHLPPQLHLVITTRADPALPLARLRARGELVEIRAADLRFTPEEAAAYLNEVMGLDLGASEVVALEARTEGLDRRPPAGSALDPGPRRRRRLHRGIRRGRPLHRRLPGRRGLAPSTRTCPPVPTADLDPGSADWPSLRCRYWS